MTLRAGLEKKKVEEFRSLLLAQRESLVIGLKQATAELIDDEMNFTDSLDQASADTDRAMTVQMKNRGRDTLLQIDGALRRIDEGSFGACEHCDESISEARIKAFPFTTLCIDCKAELESEESRFPGRA